MANEQEIPQHPYRAGAELNEALIVTTGNEVDGHRIERYLGVVRGIVVRSTEHRAGLQGLVQDARRRQHRIVRRGVRGRPP